MKTLELYIKRKTRTPQSIVGDFLIESIKQCFTIERSNVCIPEGRYEIKIYNSPKFKMEVPILMNVPGRDMIEIHPANFPVDVEGCIGVGRTHPQMDFIGESRLAFNELMPKIKDGLSKGKVFVTVA